MKELQIVKTADGSVTLEVGGMDETYHSRHGAIQEAKHVFIQMGLDKQARQISDLKILECGFGTGLNALLTAEYAIDQKRNVYYETLENYPLPPAITDGLNYTSSDGPDGVLFKNIHLCAWEEVVQMAEYFALRKRKSSIQTVSLQSDNFDLIYYDAFGPRAQPEMWELPIFKKLYDALKLGGILVTYCAKGQVRRDLIASGFSVERLAGPPGKREMLRATKLA